MFDPVEKLKEFVRHPSVSTDPAYREGMEGARGFISGLLSGIGFEVQVVKTPMHPIVLARRTGPAHWPHLVIYGHYDVQPPDPLEKWTTPPFDPQVRDGRLFGRGAADNKGPLIVHISAAARVLEENPGLPLRITFLVEGEEEIGSPSFGPFLQSRHPWLADADFVFLSDTGSPTEKQVVITCGLRGLVIFEIELTGPRTDLHSGVHGGAVLNPIQALAGLAASLHTPDGRVNIPGFYDDVAPVAQWERAEIAGLGTSLDDYARFLGVSRFHTAGGVSPFEAVRCLPTLEFNGIGGGYQGPGSKTVIPARAFAKISCRLVPDQAPVRIRSLVYAALRDRCPEGVTLNIIDGHLANCYRIVPPGRPDTPADQPPVLAAAFRALDDGVRRVWGAPPLYLREGGSVPVIADIKRVLGLDSLLLGLFLPEDNLHAPDEAFSLAVLRRGVEVSAGVLRSVAAHGR